MVTCGCCGQHSLTLPAGWGIHMEELGSWAPGGGVQGSPASLLVGCILKAPHGPWGGGCPGCASFPSRRESPFLLSAALAGCPSWQTPLRTLGVPGTYRGSAVCQTRGQGLGLPSSQPPKVVGVHPFCR